MEGREEFLRSGSRQHEGKRNGDAQNSQRFFELVEIGMGVWAGSPGIVVVSKAGKHGQLEKHLRIVTGEKIAKSWNLFVSIP